jgi:hypothetical protein
MRSPCGHLRFNAREDGSPNGDHLMDGETGITCIERQFYMIRN